MDCRCVILFFLVVGCAVQPTHVLDDVSNISEEISPSESMYNQIASCKTNTYSKSYSYASGYCIRRLAVLDMNITICDEIENEYVRENCIEIIEKADGDMKWASCHILGWESNHPFYAIDGCMLNLAINRSDISMCNETGIYQSECNHYFFEMLMKASSGRYNVSVVTGNSSICLSMLNYEPKNCVAADSVEQINMTYCSRLSDDEISFITCTVGVALKQQDYGLCNLINTSWDRSRCLTNIAVLTNDTSICELVDIDAFYDNCMNLEYIPYSNI